MQTVNNEIMQSGTLFTDPTSGREFRYYKYFDHTVVQDVVTGRINAGKFVMDLFKAGLIGKRLHDFKHTDDYQLAIESCKDEILKSRGMLEKSQTSTDSISYTEAVEFMYVEYAAGYGNDVKGSYCIFEVFQLIALWADKKHKREILKLLKAINDTANATDTSAYDVLHKTIEDLEKQIETKDKKIETLESQVADLTSPTNKLHQSYIYAKQIGEYFPHEVRKSIFDRFPLEVQENKSKGY